MGSHYGGAFKGGGSWGGSGRTKRLKNRDFEGLRGHFGVAFPNLLLWRFEFWGPITGYFQKGSWGSGRVKRAKKQGFWGFGGHFSVAFPNLLLWRFGIWGPITGAFKGGILGGGVWEGKKAQKAGILGVWGSF